MSQVITFEKTSIQITVSITNNKRQNIIVQQSIKSRRKVLVHENLFL